MTTTTMDITTLGEQWTEEVVQVNELRIDPSYQRDQCSLANEIGRNFDMVLAGLIVVNERADGLLYVIDGQQRMSGARKAGECELLARVFRGLTIEEEAQMFTHLNNTKPLTALDKFKGAYAAGRADAITIYQVVHSFGAKIAGVDGRGDAITAVRALQDIYERGGERQLAETLDVIKRGRDTLTKHTTHAQFMKAVFMFVSRNGREGADSARLARQIKKRTFEAIQSQAIALGSRSADATSYYRALCEAYSYGLPATKRVYPILRSDELAPPIEEEGEQ